MFEGKTVLITGGTGSLGQALTRRLLSLDVKAIRIFSRNESKQIEMENNFEDKRIRYFLGDIRDLDRLSRATEDVDIVFHAAAIKHVPKIEYNPFEAIKTNVIGSQNVIEACINANVEKAICVGTDKAVSPLNTYGATKLLMEKLFVTASNYLNKQKHQTKFIALRYGNVLGSSGSVIPLFIEQIKTKNKITITNKEMTRFSITMDEALDFILKSAIIGNGSEIFVPKLRAYTIEDVKESLFEIIHKSEEEVVGIRPGEKLHETLINENELRNTYEIDDKFVILNPNSNDYDLNAYNSIKKTEITQSYSSDIVEKIPKNELGKIISKERNL